VTSDFLRVPLHVLPADSGCVIDCDTCTVRGDACDDCVVGVMLGGPPGPLDPDGHRALAVLAGAGLVPPLQMTPPPASRPPAPPAPPAPPGGAPPGPAAPGPPAPPEL
jgi:hypothetical protein